MLRFRGRIVKLFGAMKDRANDRKRVPAPDHACAFQETSLMCPPRVGIVGAGQLARMTAQAAISLGIELRILATSFHESAARTWPDIVLGSPDDAMAVELLASACDITTFDHELVDVEAIQILESKGLRFAPNGATMAVAQSKRMQRERFAALGLPVPAFAIAHGERTLPLCLEFANQHGWPLMIKADRGGYDGRGVWKVGSKSERGRSRCRAGPTGDCRGDRNLGRGRL